jgi:hypothetical protein
MSSISEEIREIEQEIARLYRKKRVLEEEQQRQWEKMFPPMTAKVDERPDYIRIAENPGPEWMADSEDNQDHLLGGNYAFDDEWSGTLLG